MLPKQLKMKQKNKKTESFGMLLGTLGARLLGHLLTGKGVKAKILGEGVIRAGKGTIRVGEGTIRELVRIFNAPQLILKYNNINKMNLSLMVFTQEIIYLQ